MSDPTINTLRRPFYKEEVEDYGNITFKDARFDIGVVFKDSDGNFIRVPEGLGRVIQYRSSYRKHNEDTISAAVNCTDQFKFVN